MAVLAASCALVAILVWRMTGVVRAWLIARGIYDAPNERSSHDIPKPRGGGIALLSVVFPAWALTGALGGAQPGLWVVLALAVLVATLSFVDDVRGLPPAPRFLAQAVAVAVGLTAFGDAQVFQGLLPFWLDRALAALAWLWFVNAFNFMDGIDGISGVETLAIGAGLGAVALLGDSGVGAAALPLLLAAGAIGFLIWNWAPSKVFLGDAGSITLGFVLGWLLLRTAADGDWAVALILPAYYLADATLTLLKRVLRGAKPWRAHREHAYQRAVQRGASHARVAGVIAVGNAALVACAAASLYVGPLWSLLGAMAVVALMLAGLRRARSLFVGPTSRTG